MRIFSATVLSVLVTSQYPCGHGLWPCVFKMVGPSRELTRPMRLFSQTVLSFLVLANTRVVLVSDVDQSQRLGGLVHWTQLAPGTPAVLVAKLLRKVVLCTKLHKNLQFH